MKKNMKNSIPFAVIALLLFYSCNTPSADTNTANHSGEEQNRAFDQYKELFIEDFWTLYPGNASSQGNHQCDSILVVPTDDFHKKEIAFASRHLDSLHRHDIAALNASNKTDYYILENMLQGITFYTNEFKEYEWNPAWYNVGGGFAEIVQSKHASIQTKLHALYVRMATIPAYYEAAKQNIKKPTLEHTDLAIQQNAGSLEVFKGMLTDSLKSSSMEAAEVQKIDIRIKESVKAIEDYIHWLKQDVKPGLTPQTARSFRIGKDLYEKKFKFDIVSHYTAEEIYNKALQRKKELQAEMLKITRELYKKYFPKTPTPAEFTIAHTKELIDEISKKHVHRDSFQVAIEKQLPELTKFVSDRNLLYLDPSKPLVVRKEPEYMAGVAGASISSPGPYDKQGNTYYNVGSMAGYTHEGAESYLREYNHYILQILNIHEAIPGHYAQLVYSNQSPSLIKSLFGNGAMVEGWAVYAERMMLENGYGNNEPEMWLMYYKWHLRTVCNTLIDYSIQVLDKKKEEVVTLLVEEAFQQKQEAENKWKRASLSQVQLTSYFTGYTEIYELREELKSKQSNPFNLKEFHEKFLSYGSAPVKYIRQLMLEK
jgi:uncharacterized protein (DUF885 family)